MKSKWANASYDVMFFAKESVIFGVRDEIAYQVVFTQSISLHMDWINRDIQPIEIAIMRVKL
jgi:hypothetical protein